MFGWWQRKYFVCSPLRFPFWRTYFPNGVDTQPPTRCSFARRFGLFGRAFHYFQFSSRSGWVGWGWEDRLFEEVVFSLLLVKDVETIVEASHGLKNNVSDIHPPLYLYCIYTLKMIGPSYGRVWLCIARLWNLPKNQFWDPTILIVKLTRRFWI